MRHDDVADNEIRVELPHECNALLAVRRQHQLVPLEVQQLPHEIEVRLIVVDEQYPRHDQCAFARCVSGSRTLMRVPASTLLSIEIVPPCNSTAFLTITSPRPVPWRVPTLEARGKLSNRRAWSSTGMPMPWSPTSITASSPSRSSSSSDTVLPEGEYFTALESRLVR